MIIFDPEKLYCNLYGSKTLALNSKFLALKSQKLSFSSVYGPKQILDKVIFCTKHKNFFYFKRILQFCKQHFIYY